MYFTGKNTGSENVTLRNPRGGIVTVMFRQSDYVQVMGRTGKKYGVWLNQASNSLIGEKMFIRYAVKVVVTDEKIHVWIKRMGGMRPKSRSMGRSMYTRGDSYVKRGSRYYTPVRYKY